MAQRERAIMIVGLLHLCDGVSKALLRVSMLLLVGLIGLTTYEVVSRYVFSAPTLWGFDLIYLLNGSLLALGVAYTLFAGEHVRIDVLSSRLPQRLQRGAGAAFYILLFLPAVGLLATVAVEATWHAYATDDRVLSSAWRPYKWPFYLPLAIGLTALWLQSLAETLRLLTGIAPGAYRHHDEAGSTTLHWR